MVLLTQVLACVKKLPRKYLRTRFLDTLRLNVRAGTGGTGLPQYGGIGGKGGSVYVVAKEGKTLEDVLRRLKGKRIKAESGSDSAAKGIIGIPGEDFVVPVPLGITVYNQNGVLLGELNHENSKLLVARGGIGGCTETGFCGLKGESQTIELDLKLIADVGLVGFPNAGKSTLLAAISNAKPKIANYPFTTIRPRIGIVQYKDQRQISVADLPGLIEGAHVNIGMGHKFLKHIERTKLLLFIVDIQGFQLSPKHMSRSCLETVLLLNKEIELYKADLLRMPALILINKMDTKSADIIYKEIKPALRDLTTYAAECPEDIRPEQVMHFEDILPVSLISKNQQEIQMIKQQIRDILDKYEERKHAAEHSTQDSLDSHLTKRLKRQTEHDTPIVL